MNTCQFCEKTGKSHIDAGDIMGVIDKLSTLDRAKVVAFILQCENPHAFHTTLALEVVERVCQYCGEDKDREDDGDRYYWLCANPKCTPHL